MHDQWRAVTFCVILHNRFYITVRGTIGHSMVEGRITPGVIVGNNSDIGAGSSIMGTLSGGGQLASAHF